MAVFTVPRGNFPAGVRQFGPFDVDPTIGHVLVQLDRTDWLDPAVKVAIRLDLSLDGGVTWSPDPAGQTVFPWAPFPVNFTGQGGVLTGPGGVVRQFSEVSFDVPQVGNVNRKIRCTMTVTGGLLRTSIIITTS